ncbi:cell division regulator GpsB [Pontibacillus marinus]|uniref:Cell cycle protein GpsB n=1 Tax=Pontibacillus marinus BH030004 = DSM 16465 TaxID=1385511 RepID=A0A0A5G376_9BACI|nr:cell division regulator GpsB [Pontibacillus marinus]KGX85515.1 cell division protein GpsB [Pontibacillus marinus BH030004 = DSM 16465]
MGLERVQYSSKDILEKDFKTAIRGYNQEEVDQFLDDVIQDYDAFQKEIERLKQENEQLKKQKPGVQQPSSPTPQRTRSATQQPQQGQVNYDVLQRLSNLEKAVFGKKYSDS